MTGAKVGLYRLYNLDHSRYGEPFALCADHVKALEDRVPYCMLKKIANEALDPCAECERLKEEPYAS